jgi:hypothetical protein
VKPVEGQRNMHNCNSINFGPLASVAFLPYKVLKTCFLFPFEHESVTEGTGRVEVVTASQSVLRNRTHRSTTA